MCTRKRRLATEGIWCLCFLFHEPPHNTSTCITTIYGRQKAAGEHPVDGPLLEHNSLVSVFMPCYTSVYTTPDTLTTRRRPNKAPPGQQPSQAANTAVRRPGKPLRSSAAEVLRLSTPTGRRMFRKEPIAPEADYCYWKRAKE